MIFLDVIYFYVLCLPSYNSNFRYFKIKSLVPRTLNLRYLTVFHARQRLIILPLHVGRRLSYIIWAATRHNLSLGFLLKSDSNQPPQLQRLARNLKFHP